ncbi:MAG: hypothetical protein EOM25_10920 [Deltaproteobacteria bacterium]|nr:hypothetical protein [Deltaproteobacteria bacterium]
MNRRLNQLRTVLLLIGSLFVLMSCDGGDGSGDGDKQAIVTGPEVSVLQTTVSSQGGNLAIAGTGTPLDGGDLNVSFGAFPNGASVSVKYAEIVSHDLGPKVDPVMGVIRIKVGEGYGEEINILKIPVSAGAGRYVMGFYVDESTGELSAVPSVYENGYVHLLASRFGTGGASSTRTRTQSLWESASILISSFDVNVMLSMDADSGFRPAVDDWEFPNRGAYNAPGGICTGISMTAMYYFTTQKSSRGPLYGKYDRLENLWEDNPQGYRWSAQAQEDYKRFNSSKYFYEHFLMFSDSDLAQYIVLANAIHVTGQPQSVGIFAQNGLGHALVAYRAHNRKISVADSNWPADTGRTITLKADNTFEAYEGAAEQGGQTFPFPYIYFCAKDADLDWRLLDVGWREFQAGTAGTAIMPPYRLSVDGSEIEDTYSSGTSPVRLGIESAQAGGENLGFHVYDSEGTFLTSGYGADLNLEEGTNVFGVYVLGQVALSGTWEYVDFRWIEIEYQGSGQHSYAKTFDVSLDGYDCLFNGRIRVSVETDFPFTVHEVQTINPTLNFVFTLPEGKTKGTARIRYHVGELSFDYKFDPELIDIVGTYISDHSVFPARASDREMSEFLDVEHAVECTTAGQFYTGLNVTMVGTYRYKSGGQNEQSCSKRGTVAMLYFTPE